MSAQVEELADNKVRLTVDVPREDVHHAVEHAASDLAESVKIPGFRKGKVPMPVLVSRIGKERLYSEAIESHIGSWYGNAVAMTRIRPAEQPELDYELPDSDSEDWRFTATVSVLPTPEVPDWSKLQVPYAEPEIPEDIVDHELNVLRSTVAELAPVEDRPTQLGDTIVVDLEADDGGGQRDYVVELGTGRLLEELEEQLVGMASGETKQLELDRPGEEEPASIQATVKEIKEKVLPELDDELARSASEFDTLDELRAEIGERLRAQLELEADEAFRRATVDRLVEAAAPQVSGPVVDARTRGLLRELDTVMRRSGTTLDTYSPGLGRLARESRRDIARAGGCICGRRARPRGDRGPARDRGHGRGGRCGLPRAIRRAGEDHRTGARGRSLRRRARDHASGPSPRPRHGRRRAHSARAGGRARGRIWIARQGRLRGQRLGPPGVKEPA